MAACVMRTAMDVPKTTSARQESARQAPLCNATNPRTFATIGVVFPPETISINASRTLLLQEHRVRIISSAPMGTPVMATDFVWADRPGTATLRPAVARTVSATKGRKPASGNPSPTIRRATTQPTRARFSNASPACAPSPETAAG